MINIALLKGSNQHVEILTDSGSCVGTLVNPSSNVKSVAAMLKRSLLQLWQNNNTYQCGHFAGEKNVICDDLSRQKRTVDWVRSSKLPIQQVEVPAELISWIQAWVDNSLKDLNIIWTNFIL